MPGRERRIDRGHRLARSDLVRIGRDIRASRTGAGLTCATVGAAAGMSGAHIARIERAEVLGVSVMTLAGIASIVGLDLRVRAYPGPDPLRDQGQLRLLDRLRARVDPSVIIRTEVPLPLDGDLRAWDALLDLIDPVGTGRRGLPCEAETRLADWQAQTRRMQVKLRDAGEPHLLLVVADTHANRHAVAAAGGAAREAFPISARAALAALAEGRHPGGSSLIFL